MKTKPSAIIRQPSFRAQAIERIRTAIISGDLAPGSMHSEAKVAKAMDISRTPVREALLQLAEEGLVELIPHRGVRINDLDPSYLIDLFKFRAAIESFCVGQLAINSNRKILDALKQELKRQNAIIEKNNTGEWPKANSDFHMIILNSANNQLIDNAVRPLVTHILRLGYYVSEKNLEHIKKVFSEHCAIVEAIEKGCQDTARILAEEHLLRAASFIKSQIISRKFP